MDSNPMPLRRLDIDLEHGFARRWNGNDAYATQLYNALSMMFPAGEQNFIDVTREFLPLIEQSGPPALATAVRAFTAQESTHRFVHSRYNETLREQGYRNLVEPLIRFRIRVSRRFAPLSRLAIVIAYEHFTAVLGDGFLRHPQWSEAMDEPLKTVWAWHAAEETEHKSVAFDVYQWAGGTHLRRVFWFCYVSLIFTGDILLQTTALLWRDRALVRFRTWHSAFHLWWGPQGLGRQITPHWLAYLSPRFHPWNHDNRELIDAWRSAYRGRYQVLQETAR